MQPGDRLPGIPTHLLKLGLQYKATDAWTIGVTGVAATGQYLFGDEANLTKQMPGYFVLNLNTSYQITPNVEIFGLVQNVLDTKYYVYGTFSPTSSLVFFPGTGRQQSAELQHRRPGRWFWWGSCDVEFWPRPHQPPPGY